jgi:PAS domain S-box-containing protein
MTHNNKQITKIFTIFFIFAIALVLTSAIVERVIFDYESKITALDNAEKKVFEREDFFNGFLQSMKMGSYALESSSVFKEFLKNDNEETRKNLNQLLFTFGKFHQDISQLRYVDRNGMEVIRVQRDTNNTFTFIPDDKMQDKSHRYYYLDAKSKKPGEVYFSAFDLNIEYKNVEIPFKPTVRAIIRIENQGDFDGLLILNYSMTHFLKKFVNSPLYDVILADENGYTLFHYNKENSWGAYKKEKYTIKNDFPDEYQHILTNNFLRTDKFVSKKLDLDLHNNLYLILQFKKTLYDLEKQKNLKRDIILSAIVLLFSGISIFFIIRVFKDIFLNYNEIKKLNEKLKEQAYTISEHSIYSQTDLKGIITYASDAFCELSGYSKDELIGHAHNIVRHPDMPSSTYKEIWKKLKNEESWDGEILNKKKDGTPYWVYSMIAPNYDNNKLIGYISTRVNITSQKEIEVQNELLKEQEKLALLGEMFGNIVHQWKQPLSVISAATNGMKVKSQLGKLDESAVDQYADSVERSIQYLTETIDTFKDYVQGKKEFKNYPIQHEIEKVITIMQPMIKAHNITFISNLDKIEYVYVDSVTNELAQVLMVLFSNAKDIFEERDTQEPWIKLELLKHEDKVVLSVEDNAGGVPDNVLPQLFKKYFTTKDDNKGTGLGLYMSKEIIEESLHGKLYVKNTENGAKFFIELPL